MYFFSLLIFLYNRELTYSPLTPLEEKVYLKSMKMGINQVLQECVRCVFWPISHQSVFREKSWKYLEIIYWEKTFMGRLENARSGRPCPSIIPHTSKLSTMCNFCSTKETRVRLTWIDTAVQFKGAHLSIHLLLYNLLFNIFYARRTIVTFQAKQKKSFPKDKK